MNKPHTLIASLALYAALAAGIAQAEPIDAKSVAGNDSKISTQGLKRAQKAEASKKLLEKKRAEDKAREEALEKRMAKCKGKGCQQGPFDQSSLYSK